MNNIIINIPKNIEYSIEIKNELTDFLDKYNILLQENNQDVHEYVKTYIDIDTFDIKSILNDNVDTYNLSFRIPGATRGAFEIKETQRETISNDNNEKYIKIEYDIISVDFCESSCFGPLHAYTKDVIDASKENIVGTKIIFYINK